MNKKNRWILIVPLLSLLLSACQIKLTPDELITESSSISEEIIVKQEKTTEIITETNTDSKEEYVSEETIISETIPEPEESPYTLKRSFGFYQGEMDMELITKITFTNNVPEKYEETWDASKNNEKAVIGYRNGTEIFIVAPEIYFHEDCYMMFAAENNWEMPLWAELKEIEGLDFINTSQVKDMTQMFIGNKYLTNLDLSSWDVSNVKSTKMMFSWCTSLESIELSNWDVSNVENFDAMFQGNSHVGDMKLKNLDVSKWDTSSATSMNHVFYGCSQLEQIDVSNWDVSNVTHMSHMFADCFGLKSLDLTKWDTSSIISFDALLNDCRSLTTIDVSNFNTSNCTQFSQMFEACLNLEEIIGLENWDVSQASEYAFSETFHCCKKLKEINLSNWKAEKVDNCARMFAQCNALQSVDLSGFKIDNLETTYEMFLNCWNISEIIGIENWDLTNINTENMYSGSKTKY